MSINANGIENNVVSNNPGTSGTGSSNTAPPQQQQQFTFTPEQFQQLMAAVSSATDLESALDGKMVKLSEELRREQTINAEQIAKRARLEKHHTFKFKGNEQQHRFLDKVVLELENAQVELQKAVAVGGSATRDASTEETPLQSNLKKAVLFVEKGRQTLLQRQKLITTTIVSLIFFINYMSVLLIVVEQVSTINIIAASVQSAPVFVSASVPVSSTSTALLLVLPYLLLFLCLFLFPCLLLPYLLLLLCLFLFLFPYLILCLPLLLFCLPLVFLCILLVLLCPAGLFLMTMTRYHFHHQFYLPQRKPQITVYLFQILD